MYFRLCFKVGPIILAYFRLCFKVSERALLTVHLYLFPIPLFGAAKKQKGGRQPPVFALGLQKEHKERTGSTFNFTFLYVSTKVFFFKKSILQCLSRKYQRTVLKIAFILSPPHIPETWDPSPLLLPTIDTITSPLPPSPLVIPATKDAENKNEKYKKSCWSRIFIDFFTVSCYLIDVFLQGMEKRVYKRLSKTPVDVCHPPKNGRAGKGPRRAADAHKRKDLFSPPPSSSLSLSHTHILI